MAGGEGPEVLECGAGGLGGWQGCEGGQGGEGGGVGYALEVEKRGELVGLVWFGLLAGKEGDGDLGGKGKGREGNGRRGVYG